MLKRGFPGHACQTITSAQAANVSDDVLDLGTSVAVDLETNADFRDFWSAPSHDTPLSFRLYVLLCPPLCYGLER